MVHLMDAPALGFDAKEVFAKETLSLLVVDVFRTLIKSDSQTDRPTVPGDLGAVLQYADDNPILFRTCSVRSRLTGIRRD